MTLQDWKKWKGYDLAKFAKALQISESFASLLLNNKRGVSPGKALHFERLTDKQVSKEELVWPELYGP